MACKHKRVERIKLNAGIQETHDSRRQLILGNCLDCGTSLVAGEVIDGIEYVLVKKEKIREGKTMDESIDEVLKELAEIACGCAYNLKYEITVFSTGKNIISIYVWVDSPHKWGGRSVVGETFREVLDDVREKIERVETA